MPERSDGQSVLGAHIDLRRRIRLAGRAVQIEQQPHAVVLGANLVDEVA